MLRHEWTWRITRCGRWSGNDLGRETAAMMASE
jgi:hypothetical protein